ncbi:hypothetical protein pdam_00017819 [Pocillopora damicornis]|uniref:Uncharacterized protein n=1 Tax=Pocillopora damicornis TaxID=46731 RepID=A0A3M6TYK6_POCDA|nr:hypothetical protein pdam_00017819 [Pocillopora damicornis]
MSVTPVANRNGREHNSETPFRVLYERLLKFFTRIQLFKGWINRYAADMGYGNVVDMWDDESFGAYTKTLCYGCPLHTSVSKNLDMVLCSDVSCSPTRTLAFGRLPPKHMTCIGVKACDFVSQILMKLPEGMKKILKHFLQYLTALRVGKNKRNSNNNLDLPFQAAVLNIPGVIIGTVLLYLQNTVLKRQKEVL